VGETSRKQISSCFREFPQRCVWSSVTQGLCNHTNHQSQVRR